MQIEAKLQTLVFEESQRDEKGSQVESRPIFDGRVKQDPQLCFEFTEGKQEGNKQNIHGRTDFDSYISRKKKETSTVVPSKKEYSEQLEGNGSELVSKEESSFIPTEPHMKIKSSFEGDSLVESSCKQNKKFESISNEGSIITSKKLSRLRKNSQDKFDANNMTKNIFQSPAEEDINYTKQQRRKGDIISKEYLKSPSRKLPPIIQNSKFAPQRNMKESQTLPSELKNTENNQSSMIFFKGTQGKGKNQLRENNGAIMVSEEAEQVGIMQALRRVIQGETRVFQLSRQKGCFLSYQNPRFILKDGRDQLLLNAKKQWGHMNSFYNLSCQENNYSSSGHFYAGCLKGNFSGSCFNIYHHRTDCESSIVATIYYNLECKCSTIRKVEVYLKSDKTVADVEDRQNLNLKELYDLGGSQSGSIIKLINKQPQWNQKHSCFVLDFKGKTKYSSVKNMILINQKTKKQALLFGKTDRNEFHLECSYPLSPFIAFGVILTSFDFKLLCQ